MRCPRCGFDGSLVGDGCARCGYGRVDGASGPISVKRDGSSRVALQRSSPSLSGMWNALMRGDMLRQGRYRLVEQLTLPENQQGQGTAWLATDSQSSARRVIIREVALPQGNLADKQRMVRSIATRLAELGEQPGFPAVLDVFSERDGYFIVLRYPDGESLASLLKRQGGALPERVVAEYGVQLCEMLSTLARQQPPLVHGSINPETIIVSPDETHVSLLHVPLFPPKELHNTRDAASSGYVAPEQARGVVDPSSDLYGLAATLHHAVTGSDPRERSAFFHPPARRLNPAVTARMEEILAQALRLSVPQRYAQAADIQRDLSALIASYPAQREPPNVVTGPIHLSAAQMRERSRSSSLLDVGMFAAVGVLILLGFLFAVLRPVASVTPPADRAKQTATSVAAPSRQQVAALNAELALEMQSFQKKSIGISDGRLVFDIYTGRSDVDLKQQAARAIQRDDMSSAVDFLTKAISADPTDGEAQIYNEDVHILQRGAPYVTIVLGLAIDSSAIHLLRERADIQAAYIAQHEVNMGGLLPQGRQLRILIDNSGADNANVATAAQFIANRVAHVGNLDHIIAVVGWPFSSETTNARDIVASAHVPLVSQTASSVKLSGSSPYFFRVNPPDDAQGDTLGKVAVQQLHAKKILVLRDPTDPYSVSLANAFTASVEALNATTISSATDNFTEGTTTISDYRVIVEDAVANRVDLIFLAGFDVDGVRLAHALGNASRAEPASTLLANLKILGGDGLDTNLLLGQGSGPEAMIALNFQQDMRRLIFSAFADPKEWTLLGIPQNQQPAFFADWANTYQNPAGGANSAPLGNDAMLTNDAVQVIVKAATLVQSPLTSQAVRDALTSLGQGNIPAFQGVSGRIVFNKDGNPIDKAVVVLSVQLIGDANAIELVEVAGKFR